MVERYFEILGMLKAVIESPHFDIHEDSSFLQHLLRDYDIPSTLKICKVYLEDQSFEHAKTLLQRILAIDPFHEEARRI
jgi:DNA-binding SARP family transcriptional activator